jgi:hypothetical protein
VEEGADPDRAAALRAEHRLDGAREPAPGLLALVGGADRVLVLEVVDDDAARPLAAALHAAGRRTSAGGHDGALVCEDEVVVVVLDEPESIPEDAVEPVEPVVLAGLVQDRLFEVGEEPHHLRIGVRQEERERLDAVALEPDRVDRRGPGALREAAREERRGVLVVVLQGGRYLAVDLRDRAGEELREE